MGRTFESQHTMQALDVDWLAVVFDGFHNAIDIAADFLLITVFGDTDALVVIVGFVDYNEARRQLAYKGNVSSGIIGSFVFREAVGDVLDAADAAVFGKVADN